MGEADEEEEEVAARRAARMHAQLVAAAAEAEAEAIISGDMLSAALEDEQQMFSRSMRLTRDSVRAEREAAAAAASYRSVRAAYDASQMAHAAPDVCDEPAALPLASALSFVARLVGRLLRRRRSPPQLGTAPAAEQPPRVYPPGAWSRKEPPTRIGLRLVEATAHARRIEARAAAQAAAEAAEAMAAATARVAALRERAARARASAATLQGRLAAASEPRPVARPTPPAPAEDAPRVVGDLGAAVGAAVGEEASSVVADLLRAPPSAAPSTEPSAPLPSQVVDPHSSPSQPLEKRRRA